METTVPSTKPYLLRAIYEWAEDNGFTAQVLVNCDVAGVVVPKQFIKDGQIVLNISSSATRLLAIQNELLQFSARFSGVEREIRVPVPAILAVFTRENSQGIYFDEPAADPQPSPETEKKDKKHKRSERKKNAHLKIIK